jgi:hypothetical protein
VPELIIPSAVVAPLRAARRKGVYEDIKRLISFLPDNNLSDAPMYSCSDDLNRISEDIVI